MRRAWSDRLFLKPVRMSRCSDNCRFSGLYVLMGCDSTIHQSLPEAFRGNLEGLYFMRNRRPLNYLQKYQGCLSRSRLGQYCEAHKAAGEAREVKYKADREKRLAVEKARVVVRRRRYGYRWQRLRVELAGHPLCVECGSAGCSSWRPTSTTSGRTRGTRSSCGTRTTFRLSATNVTAGRRRERMAVLGSPLAVTLWPETLLNFPSFFWNADKLKNSLIDKS